MKTSVRYKTFDQLSIADHMVYSRLPRHPFWSAIEEKIDFTFADALCAFLYSGRGQHPYAPSLKLKIHLVQLYYQLSDRQTEEKIMGDLFIKRFLGLPVDFFGFDHSTIGLDRSRLGAGLFLACHRYILAQLYQMGLWDKEEAWIIDSFPMQVHGQQRSSYRRIQHSAKRLMELLQRYRPDIHTPLQQNVDVAVLTAVPATGLSKADYLLAYSRMVTQVYGMAVWLDAQESLHTAWPTEQAERRFHKRLHLLHQLLDEHTEPTPPEEQPAPEQSRRKKPRASLPKSRSYTLRDPEARIGRKSKTVMICGYKVQVLMSEGGTILETRVIPGDEHDRDAMVEMVNSMRQSWMQPSTRVVLGDTLYGLGEQRVALGAERIRVVAPVPASTNPKKGLPHDAFTYDPKADAYQCPQGNRSEKKSYIKQSQGWQYKFNAEQCNACPMHERCTTSEKGRTVFHSIFYAQYEQARKHNATVTGAAELRKRGRIERKNNELKNHCGLGKVWTCSKEAAAIKAHLAGIVVNLKRVSRCFSPPGSWLVRHAI